MAKKKFYVVRRGRQTGIFQDWDEVKQLVDGYPRPEYKGFQTHAEAQAYLAGGNAAAAGSRPAARWYGIRRGTVSEVRYALWADVQPLVIGAPEAICKGFQTEAEARAFVGLPPAGDGQAGPGAPQQQGPSRQLTPGQATSGQRRALPPAAPPPMQPAGWAAAPQPGPRDPAFGPDAFRTEASTSGLDDGGRAAKRARQQEAPPSIRLMFDGGSRGNPGRAGYGYVILDEQGQPLFQGCRPLDYGSTNNQAEYAGLIAGMKRALSMGIKQLLAMGDSDLVIKQMTGLYTVKSDKLRPLHGEALALTRQFDSFVIQHVYRKDNQLADQLANLAMDIDEAISAIGHMDPCAPRVTVARVLASSADLHPDDRRTMLLEPQSFLEASAELIARICDQQDKQVVRAQLLDRGWTEQTGECMDGVDGWQQGAGEGEEEAEEAAGAPEQQLQQQLPWQQPQQQPQQQPLPGLPGVGGRGSNPRSYASSSAPIAANWGGSPHAAVAAGTRPRAHASPPTSVHCLLHHRTPLQEARAWCCLRERRMGPRTHGMHFVTAQLAAVSRPAALAPGHGLGRPVVMVLAGSSRQTGPGTCCKAAGAGPPPLAASRVAAVRPAAAAASCGLRANVPGAALARTLHMFRLL